MQGTRHAAGGPRLLLSLPLGQLGFAGLFAICMAVNVGMWLERFIIVVTSLHRDFLPGSWGMYYPTIWDWATFVGTMGLFLTLFYLFIRVLPIIAIFEVRTLTPAAHNKGDGHHG